MSTAAQALFNNKAIHKFVLDELKFTGMVSAKRKWLTAQMRHGVPTVWAEVEPESGNRETTLVCVGTRHPLPNLRRYIWTVQEGPFVWHIYEARP